MQETAKVPRPDDPAGEVVDPELADVLLARAQASGVDLLGPEGLLSQVTKAVLERALAEEMTAHLGYEKHDPAGRGSGSSRNGHTPKTVLADVGAVDLAVPRDRNGTFEPRIVRKGQSRLKGFNERIIALYARGMSTRDIRAHLREMYDAPEDPRSPGSRRRSKQVAEYVPRLPLAAASPQVRRVHGRVLKTARAGDSLRGFKSHTLRHHLEESPLTCAHA
jgi:putative transposase